jgi:hypothetical protein
VCADISTDFQDHISGPENFPEYIDFVLTELSISLDKGREYVIVTIC